MRWITGFNILKLFRLKDSFLQIYKFKTISDVYSVQYWEHISSNIACNQNRLKSRPVKYRSWSKYLYDPIDHRCQFIECPVVLMSCCLSDLKTAIERLQMTSGLPEGQDIKTSRL